MLVYVIGFIGVIFGILALIALAKMAKVIRRLREKRRIAHAETLARQKEEEEWRRIEEGKSKIEEYRESNDLSAILFDSQMIFSTLSHFVDSAEAHINKAEHEFSDRAYAPFWDAVEYAVNQLAAYHDKVTQITSNAKEYATRQARLSFSIQDFSVIEEGGLPDARPTAIRLAAVIREGQKDFEFATIYEQRKAHRLLHAGFGTLAAGIDQMQYAIPDALASLSDSLGGKLDDLVDVSNTQTEQIARLNKQFARNAKAQREFEMQSLMAEAEESASARKNS